MLSAVLACFLVTGFESASRIEKVLGVHVLRHRIKKPGNITEVMAYFRGCAGSDITEGQLCVIGDRLMTDVLYGNLNNMFTVHTKILTSARDNKAAAVVRRMESGVLGMLRKSGRFHPRQHPLLSTEAAVNTLRKSLQQ